MASGRNQIVLTRGIGISSSKTAAPMRNLGKSMLGGVIFGCTSKTITECLLKQVFGLPAQHMIYVQHIEPGLPLFLFNYTDRKLHGVFEAASRGQMNINPYGWTENGSQRTQYPAQVQVHVRQQCQPLSEERFKPVIADNYFNLGRFCFELDVLQSNKLIALLVSAVVTPIISAPQNLARWRTNLQYFPSLDTKDAGLDSSDIASSFDDDDQFRVHDMNKRAKQQDASELIWKESNKLAQAREHQDVEDSFLVDGKQSQAMEPKESTHCGDYQDMPSVRIVERASAVSVMCLKGNVSAEENYDGRLSSASEFQPVLAQLIRDIEELKASKEKQSKGLGLLETKMFKAEREIQQLKDRCSILESMSNSHVVSADYGMIDTSEVVSFDPTEKIFLLGGYNGERWLSSLDSYHPSRNVMNSLSSTNFSRSHASVAWLNGELYAFGGGADGLLYDTVESYSITNDQWVMRPSMGKKRGHLAGASLDGKLFAIGGGNEKKTFSDVEMLDLDIGRWVPTRSMLEKRFGLASVELNGALYVSGGYDGAAYLKSAERFDPREYSWHKIPNMLMRRGCHSMVALNEKVYTFGGCNEHETLSSLEIFDPRLDSWIPGGPMHTPRAYAGAAVVKDTIYIIGGLGDGNDIVDTVERYMESQDWQENTSPIGKRCYLSAIVMD